MFMMLKLIRRALTSTYTNLNQKDSDAFETMITGIYSGVQLLIYSFLLNSSLIKTVLFDNLLMITGKHFTRLSC